MNKYKFLMYENYFSKYAMKKFLLLSSIILAITIVLALLIEEEIFYEEIEISFSQGENKLIGYFIRPKNTSGSLPVIVFVHGDGAMPYDAFGFYRPIWNHLAKNGIASLSWHKPGVESSTGNWLFQSMQDRADEVIAGIEVLKSQHSTPVSQIGLIGFSQAGWVLPLVAAKSNESDFMVMVSGAINWMDQSHYMTRTRMAGEGYSVEVINKAIEKNDRFESVALAQSYDDYLHLYKDNSIKDGVAMTKDRFRFVQLNWRSDARQSLKSIQCPTLAIFGDQDVNVDAIESATAYKEIFKQSGNTDLTVKVFSEAQHAILKSKYFHEARPGLWFMLKYELLGEHAFAEGYLESMTAWLDNHIKN